MNISYYQNLKIITDIFDVYEIQGGETLCFPISISNNTIVYNFYLITEQPDYSLRVSISKDNPVDVALRFKDNQNYRPILKYNLKVGISDIDGNQDFFVNSGLYYYNIHNQRGFPNKFKLIIGNAPQPNILHQCNFN